MSDRPDLIESEMGGVAFSSCDQCFRQVDLKRMFAGNFSVEIEWDTPFFITVDPTAGGEHSDFAVVSFIYTHGMYQVYLSIYNQFFYIKEHLVHFLSVAAQKHCFPEIFVAYSQHNWNTLMWM